jgi:UDP:flavonoid glycosyltransferase YjiC (YdhE family)
VPQRYTVPALPLTKILRIGIANPLFHLVRPMAFALHTLPLNRVRKKHGLQPLGFDLLRVYTDGDYTLYADAPELYPQHHLPTNHSSSGSIIWPPPSHKPDWWESLPTTKPIVYITLGSSGQGRLLHFSTASAVLASGNSNCSNGTERKAGNHSL